MPVKHPRNGGDLVSESLTAHGAECVFGIPAQHKDLSTPLGSCVSRDPPPSPGCRACDHAEIISAAAPHVAYDLISLLALKEK
jgi:hypothetical protein